MRAYQYVIEEVNGHILYKVLEAARRQSSDIVIIPRFVNSDYNGFQIAGLQSGTIAVISEYSSFKDIKNIPLWDSQYLYYIALYSKDIPGYLKIMKDNDLYELSFNSHRYIVNNKQISIARTLKSFQEVLVKNPYANDTKQELMNPLLPLLPYQEYLDKILLVINKYNNSEIVNRIEIDMRENEEFVETWSGLSSDGSKVWVPDIKKYGHKLKPYILYLAKCMFAFSKPDQVHLEIRDNIPNERTDVFMAKFIVTRIKGKDSSVHNYYVSGLKIL